MKSFSIFQCLRLDTLFHFLDDTMSSAANPIIATTRKGKYSSRLALASALTFNPPSAQTPLTRYLISLRRLLADSVFAVCGHRRSFEEAKKKKNLNINLLALSTFSLSLLHCTIKFLSRFWS